MGFGNRGAPPPSTPAGQSPAAGGPPPPNQPAVPPQPPVTQPPSNVLVYISGDTNQSYPLANIQSMADTTPAWCEGMSGWGTLADVKALHGGVVAQVPPQPQQPQQPYGQAAAGGQPYQQSGYDPYAGAENAPVGAESPPWLNHGDYVVLVKESMFKDGRNASGHLLEVKIIISDAAKESPALPQDQDPTSYHGPRQEGSLASLFFQKNDSFLGNIKEIALAANGLDPQNPSNQISQATISTTVGGQAPSVIGKLLFVKARGIKTRAGGPFTKYHFWPCGIAGTDPVTGDPLPDEESIKHLL